MNIMEIICGALVFRIGDHEFSGLRPFKYVRYPWSGKKGMNAYMDSLEREHTPYSYKKMVHFEEQMQLESIHITLSRALIFLATGILTGLIAILSKFFPTAILSYILSGATVGSFVLYILHRLMAGRKYENLILIQCLFNQFDTWVEV